MTSPGHDFKIKTNAPVVPYYKTKPGVIQAKKSDFLRLSKDKSRVKCPPLLPPPLV